MEEIKCSKCGELFQKPRSKRTLCTACYALHRNVINAQKRGYKPLKEVSSQQKWYRMWKNNLNVNW